MFDKENKTQMIWHWSQNQILTDFYSSVFEVADQCAKVGLVLYGANTWARQAMRIFAKFGVAPLAVADDDKSRHGKFLSITGVGETDADGGVCIISLDDAANRYPDAVYISMREIDEPLRTDKNKRLEARGLLSKYSGFNPNRYLFLADGALEAIKEPKTLQSDNFRAEYLNKVVALNHMLNSGIVYFQTLMDGHPNILTLCAYAGMDDVYEKRLQYLEDDELVIETAAQCYQFFSSDIAEDSEDAWSCRAVDIMFRTKEAKREKRAYIDGAQFVRWLAAELLGKGRVSKGYLTKAVLSAYSNMIGKKYIHGEQYWMCICTHDVSFDGEITPKYKYLVEEFEKSEFFFIIREPVQHIFSIAKNWLDLNKRGLWHVTTEIPPTLKTILVSDLGLTIQKNIPNREKTIHIVRFEDVKRNTEKCMRKVCDLLAIPYVDCMLSTTFGGIEVYFQTVDHSGKPVIITGQDKTAVGRKAFSNYFTSFDIFRLNLVTQDFKRNCGYKVDIPHYSEFSAQCLREMFELPFQFTSMLEEKYEMCRAEGKYEGCYYDRNQPGYHRIMVDLFLDYMQKGPQEMLDTFITPDDELIEI